jgi:glycosyltransferase involved in cell wall biosynthesis
VNIAVAHWSINPLGGAEKLCLTVIKSLKSAGHKVTLITVEKTDWMLVKRNFGHVYLPDNQSFLTTSNISKSRQAFNITLAFTLFGAKLLSLRKEKAYDVIINTYGDIDVLCPFADITYIHFPIRAISKYSQFPPITSIIEWKLYHKLYSSATFFLDPFNQGIIITNSKFTKKVIRDYLHKNALVVYPPVNAKLLKTTIQIKGRKNIVATVSGYSPKRRLEYIPLIAKYARSAKFIVVGRTGAHSQDVLKKLDQIARRLNVRDRISFLTDVPRPELLKLLSQAKVYLHTMPYDHFGIALVEAMALGCVPVVHRSGGPWLDILNEEQGKYGWAYQDPQEAGEYIEMLINDEDGRRCMALNALERAQLFDESVFQRKILKIVEKFS